MPTITEQNEDFVHFFSLGPLASRCVLVRSRACARLAAACALGWCRGRAVAVFSAAARGCAAVGASVGGRSLRVACQAGARPAAPRGRAALRAVSPVVPRPRLAALRPAACARVRARRLFTRSNSALRCTACRRLKRGGFDLKKEGIPFTSLSQRFYITVAGHVNPKRAAPAARRAS